MWIIGLWFVQLDKGFRILWKLCAHEEDFWYLHRLFILTSMCFWDSLLLRCFPDHTADATHDRHHNVLFLLTGLNFPAALELPPSSSCLATIVSRAHSYLPNPGHPFQSGVLLSAHNFHYNLIVINSLFTESWFSGFLIGSTNSDWFPHSLLHHLAPLE